MAKTETIIRKLYKDEVEIIFYPNSHRYKMGKKNLVSVTAVTGIIDKSQVLINWAMGLAHKHVLEFIETSSRETFSSDELTILIDEAVKEHTKKKEEAAAIGTTVHEWVENFAKAKIEGTRVPEVDFSLPEVTNGINAFLDWYLANDVEFIKNEQLVYSKEHEFVGTFDAVMKINGKLTAVDYKTSKRVYPEHKLQLTGYRIAYEEEFGAIEGLMILHFDKETGEFHDVWIPEEEYPALKEAFIACVKIKEWHKANNKW